MAEPLPTPVQQTLAAADDAAAAGDRELAAALRRLARDIGAAIAEARNT